MSTLHKASKIYVDFDNVIAKVDEFVCNKLYTNIKGQTDIIKSSPIHSFFDIIDEYGEEYISSYAETKSSINPLIDLADISVLPKEELEEYRKHKMTDNEIIALVCDVLYDDILAYDYKQDLIDDMKFTNLASSIKILLKDLKLENVYIYVKTLTPAIHKVIYDFFMNNDKITIVTGDKESFLNKVSCDTYIFNDVRDIFLLPENMNFKQDKPDVIFLKNKFNLNLWYNDYLEDDGTHKKISDKYHININILNS